MAPGALDRDRLYQHKVSLVVRYFMIPCNICLILLATSTLGFAVLLFLNNCRWPWMGHREAFGGAPGVLGAPCGILGAPGSVSGAQVVF